MTALLQRDRRILFAALSLIAISAWAYMAYEAHAMYSTGSCCCAGMKMSGPDTDAWSPATLLPLFLMWAEMMVAMMLPTAMPMILAFAAVQRKRREQVQPFVPTGLFTSGYLLVWTGFSVLAAIAQWILHGRALLSPMMVSNSPILGGALLLIAGVFQFAPFKNNCLSHCRSPQGFLESNWREGRIGALTMGLKHGLHCSGCCWFLMTLLFVAGVMNLWWIAAITILVLLEKVLPNARRSSRASGIVLIAWGIWLLWTAR
jgi:predicted metal-binding membrane protein